MHIDHYIIYTNLTLYKLVLLGLTDMSQAMKHDMYLNGFILQAIYLRHKSICYVLKLVYHITNELNFI